MNGNLLAIFLKDIQEFHIKIDGYPYYDNLAEKIIEIYYHDITLLGNDNGEDIIDVLLRWLDDSFISYSIIVPELIQMLDNFYELSINNNNYLGAASLIIEILCKLYDKLLIILKNNNIDYYFQTKRSMIRQNLVEDFINYMNNGKKLEKLLSNNEEHEEYDDLDFFGDLPDELGLGILL